MGSSYTSDLTPEGIRADGARRPSIWPQLTTEDPHAGLARRRELGSLAGDLKLYSATTSRARDADRKIDAGEARRSRRARLRSAHHQFRRRLVRFQRRRPRFRQLARLRRARIAPATVRFRAVPVATQNGSRWSATTGSPSRAISAVSKTAEARGPHRRRARAFAAWAR